MDYIEEAEKYLRSYRLLEKSIENLNKRISRLNLYPSSKVVQTYELSGVRMPDKGEDANNQLFQLAWCRDAIEDTIELLKEIDDTLVKISIDRGCERYGDLLRYWYIEKWDIDDIMVGLNLCRTSMYNHKDIAIKMFSVAIHGIGAVKSVI